MGDFGPGLNRKVDVEGRSFGGMEDVGTVRKAKRRRSGTERE